MPNYHYEGPNGNHYSHFLRVGTAFQSVDIVDAITFWLLPYIRPNSVLLLDSGTMLPLGLNVTRYLADYGYEPGRYIIPVECLCRYDEPEGEVVRRLWSLKQNSKSPIHILFLISITSSGRMKQRVVTALRESGLEADTVSLFSTSGELESTDNSFCTLEEDFRRSEESLCKMCHNDKSSVVRIDPITYEIELSANVEENKINRKDALQAQEFFTRYGGLGCVSVHRDSHNMERHHMIHIDVDVLLASDTFIERLKERVAPLAGKIDVVLSPNHQAAKALSIKVANQLGVPYINIDETDLKSARPDIAFFKSILLVDDVVVTGHRLWTYRVNLENSDLITNETELRYLVGVARPPSLDTLQGIKDMLHPRNSLYRIEELFLPNWQNRDCPWCWELGQIKNAGAIGRSSSLMQARYEHLCNKLEGMQSDIFLHWSSDTTKLRLGDGSIFGPKSMTEAELFASVAGAMQNLRNAGKLNDNIHIQ